MAKLHDKETQSIAATVSDVLEGKVKKEEVKYPHMMYSKDGKDEVEVKNKAEHEKYVAKGYVHDKPKMESPEEPKAPDGKNGPQTGEKDFKAKHGVKKSGKKLDGSDVKEEVEEVTITLDEAKKPGRGKEVVDIDWIGSNAGAKKAEKKFKVKIKIKGRGTADVTGEKKNIVAMLSDDETYGMDMDDIEDIFPELFESKVAETAPEVPVDELSDKQKKYQEFFKKALKKFGVNSPAELEKEKRKEFFDYIDKNYDAGEGESD